MTNEIFLIKEEKEKLLQRQRDYINDAIDKSNGTLQNIIRKELLPQKNAIQENQAMYQRYLNGLSKTEEEITAEIAKDESSPPKGRLKSWTKIQTLRDKAYNLRAYCQPRINRPEKNIKYPDFIEIIHEQKDEETRKYYNSIFLKQTMTEKLIDGPKIQSWKKIGKISQFLGGEFANIIAIVLAIILCILLAINNFLFMKAQGYPLIGDFGDFIIFIICASLTISVLVIVFYLFNEVLDVEYIAFAQVPYVIYLGFSIYTMLISHWDITKAVVILLIPLLIPLLVRLFFCLFNLLEKISANVIYKHHKEYKQYYRFLDEKWDETQEYCNSLIKKRIDKIKESYYLDFNQLSKQVEINLPKSEKIYLSILEKYDTWARNHSVISPVDLLSKKAKLDFSLIASEGEKVMRVKCPVCSCPYHSSTTKTDRKKIDDKYVTESRCVSGGYYENTKTSYDIMVDGSKVGTATTNDSHYVPAEYEYTTYHEYTTRTTDTTHYKCEFCGHTWQSTSTKVETNFGPSA